MNSIVLEKVKNARKSFLKISVSSSKERNNALETLITLLKKNKAKIISANELDVTTAKKECISNSLLKRLELSESKFNEILSIVKSISLQKEIIGKEISKTLLDTGLELTQVSVPLGVVCAIFEARPDAVVQISCLAIKTGNAVLLKGGKEAKNSNSILVELIRESLKANSLPEDAVQLLDSRKDVQELLSLSDFVDLIIPRGSNEFVKFIQQNSSIPVLGHSSGVCHEYIDEKADIDIAINICIDAKCQYPAACNAMETILVHESIANNFLLKFAKELNGKVELRCDKISFEILSKNFDVKKASETDWKTEYNDLILSVKVVKCVSEAINHINKFGSKHTDGIITENKETANNFLQKVDSSSVFWNASTRFADGYRYGKGAELGISTGKIHARGPSGMEALTTYKYLLKGQGQVVEDYAKGIKKFKHINI